MALVPISRPLPIDVEPWERARTNFIQGLDLEQAKLFERHDFTVEGLFYATDVSWKQHSGLAAFCNKIRPLTAALEDFGRAMDVFANAASLILSPLWGSVRVLVALARRLQQHQDTLMDLLAHIGDVLPAYRDYANIFERDQRLAQLLADAYLSILIACTNIKDKFLKGGKFSISLRFLRSSLIRAEKFAPHLQQLRYQKNAIVERAALVSMREQERRADAEKRRRLLDMLSTMDYISRHETLCSERHTGTCLWFLESEIFLDWRHSSQSRLLCCFGIPGCGKSVLTSAVINQVTEDFCKPKTASAYIHCDGRYRPTLDVAIILGCICRQLLRDRKLHISLEIAIERAYHEHRQPTPDALIDVLGEICKSLDHVSLCIDGVDELDQASQDAISAVIQSLFSLDCQFKVFVSAREDPHLSKLFSPHSHVILTRSAVARDLRSYIHDSVKIILRDLDFAQQSSTLESDITERLVSEAKDMFLWVRLQLTEIRQADSEADIRDILDNLPPDLIQTYARIVHKISTSSRGERKLELASRVCQWLYCARRPMTVDELAEAITVDADTRKLDFAMIPQDNGLSLQKCCGNLLTVDRQRRILSFIHTSVVTFLTKTDVAVLRLVPQAAAFQVADGCLSYLLLEDFESQIVPLGEGKTRISASLVRELMEPRHEAKALGLARTTAKLLHPPKRKAFCKLQFARPKAEAGQPLSERYKLLDYVVASWTDHCGQIESPTVKFLARLRQVALGRRMVFEHRPWVTASSQSNDLWPWVLSTRNHSFFHLIDVETAACDVVGCPRGIERAFLGAQTRAIESLLFEEGVTISEILFVLPAWVYTVLTIYQDPKARVTRKLLDRFVPSLANERSRHILQGTVAAVDKASCPSEHGASFMHELTRRMAATSWIWQLSECPNWSFCQGLFRWNELCPLAWQIVKRAQEEQRKEVLDFLPQGSLLYSQLWRYKLADHGLDSSGIALTDAVKKLDCRELERLMVTRSASTWLRARSAAMLLAARRCDSGLDARAYRILLSLWGIGWEISGNSLRPKENWHCQESVYFVDTCDLHVLQEIESGGVSRFGFDVPAAEMGVIPSSHKDQYLMLREAIKMPSAMLSETEPAQSWAFFLIFVAQEADHPVRLLDTELGAEHGKPTCPADEAIRLLEEASAHCNMTLVVIMLHLWNDLVRSSSATGLALGRVRMRRSEMFESPSMQPKAALHAQSNQQLWSRLYADRMVRGTPGHILASKLSRMSSQSAELWELVERWRVYLDLVP